MTNGVLEQQINLRQLAKDIFTARWHQDWAVGPTLHGGCVAAIIELTAKTYLKNDPALLAVDQPDVLNLHMEFLRACTHDDSTLKVVPLRIGATVSTVQLQLLQNDKVKVIAIATSTNFDRALGPTVVAPAAWTFSPPPKPKPDFAALLANKPDPNWVTGSYDGEIVPMTSRMLFVNPRSPLPPDGVWDAWYTFRGDERMDSTYLAFMTDVMPSMSDTLLRNGGPYDGHVFQGKAEQWAGHYPGVPLIMNPNSVAEMMEGVTINVTVTLDIEYKRRLPKEGLRFTFTRATAKTLLDGRMDVDLTICNEDMEVVCLARQVILVLGVHRKFGGGDTDTVAKF